jgi:RNA polymerase sigma-70 factor (ECF subfamily)
MLQTSIFPALETTDAHIFTDAQLLTLIGHGENWALTKIYDRYARLVFSIALKTLNDPANAEEIVQQVFMKVWQHAHQSRVERGNFSAGVGLITHNQWVDELRRRPLPLITDSNDLEALIHTASDSGLAWDEQPSLKRSDIRGALQRIPIEERMIIELAFWGGMSHQEIAPHCGSRLGTVMTRMRLAMRRLKLLFQESL